MMSFKISNRLFAEFAGTALLICVVIGSGIMGVNLSNGNDGIALLANTMATVFALYFLIEVFGPISGAHFNPVVTGAMVGLGRQAKSEFVPYVLAQLAGAWVGAVLANAMFGLHMLQLSEKMRFGPGQWLGELIATFGLLLVILQGPAQRVSSLVAAFIGAAYWFTSSTSFANPAAAFGRMFSNTFAGIRPHDVPAFWLAEVAGAVLAVLFCRLFKSNEQNAIVKAGR